MYAATLRFLLLTIAISAIPSSAVLAPEPDYAQKRDQMVRTIEQTVRATSEQLSKGELHPRVMEVLNSVPRHEFIPKNMRDAAYFNRPLSIGYGQTISQPYIVAIMTDLLNPQRTDKVLEIGTGSGYQAAVLSRLVDKVYSMEIIEELGERAQKDLKRLGYDNVEVMLADGYYGWEEHAPYDDIVVTAASSHIPPPLIEQLKPGGRMIIPVGSRFMTQQLLLIEKDENSEVTTRQILPVRFVPLTGKH